MSCLLACFLIAVGFAFNAPAWTAIQPEIVSNDELPSAATLGGLQLNISGIIGPAVGGLLLPSIGANFAFALNGLCFLLVIFAIASLRRKKAPGKPSPRELSGVLHHRDALRSLCSRNSGGHGA
jgi:MFS family permease